MDKKAYEFTYWLRIDSESEKEEEKILNLLKNFEGEIIEKNTPKKKQLSYPINKQNLGYFGTIYFSISPEKIDILRKELVLYKNILRYIIVNNVQTVENEKNSKQNLITKEIKSETIETLEPNIT